MFTFTPAPVRKASKPSPFAIIRIAENAAPEIQRAFLRAVANVKNGTVLKQVREALEKGDLRAAYQAIPWETVGEKTLKDSLPQSIRNVYEAAANDTAKRLSKDLSIQIRFDVTNPRAFEYIREHTAQLIREFGATNRETIQGILERSFREGIPPDKTARMIRDSGIGLTRRQATAVENYRNRLENDEDGSLSNAQIERLSNRYADRLLRLRTLNIARTETISASTAGQHELWQEAREDGLLGDQTLMEWMYTPDSRVCDECEEMDGETAPLGGAFSNGLTGPPLHPSCRCATRIVPESMDE